jgi:hypothetical protein
MSESIINWRHIKVTRSGGKRMENKDNLPCGIKCNRWANDTCYACRFACGDPQRGGQGDG